MVLRAGCLERRHVILCLLAAAALTSNEPAHCCPGIRNLQQNISNASACWADAGRPDFRVARPLAISLVRAPVLGKQHANGQLARSGAAGTSEHHLSECGEADRVFGAFTHRLPERYHDILRLLAADVVTAREPAQCCPGAVTMQHHNKQCCRMPGGGRVLGSSQIWRYSLVGAIG